MSRSRIDVRRVVRGLAWCTAAVVFAVGTAAWAMQTPQQEFVPATNIGSEQLPATPLLFGAYGFVWVALTFYVFLLWRRIGRVERELADVSSRLATRR